MRGRRHRPGVHSPEESGSAWACTAVVTTYCPHQGTLTPWRPGAGTAKTASHSNTAPLPRPAPPPELPGPVARRDHPRIHRRRQAHPQQGQRPDQSRHHRQAPRPAHPARQGHHPQGGLRPYTVRQAADDRLAHGLDSRSPKTVTRSQNVLAPILTVIGAASSAQGQSPGERAVSVPKALVWPAFLVYDALRALHR